MYYESEFKANLVRLHIEDGRTLKSLGEEYGVSKASLSLWVKEVRKECHANEEVKSNYESMQEVRKLRKELEESRKENLFLKKAAAFFAKEIG